MIQWDAQELQERKKIKKKERKKKKKPESEADVEAEAEADADTAQAEASEAEPGEHGDSSDEAAQAGISPETSGQDIAHSHKGTPEGATEAAESAAAATAPDGECLCTANQTEWFVHLFLQTCLLLLLLLLLPAEAAAHFCNSAHPAANEALLDKPILIFGHFVMLL